MNHKQQLDVIRSQMLQGIVSYDEARAKAQPIIDEMNIKGEKIAKKHGMKFKKFSFNTIMR